MQGENRQFWCVLAAVPLHVPTQFTRLHAKVALPHASGA
jgi:hypothetical protein